MYLDSADDKKKEERGKGNSEEEEREEGGGGVLVAGGDATERVHIPKMWKRHRSRGSERGGRRQQQRGTARSG